MDTQNNHHHHHHQLLFLLSAVLLLLPATVYSVGVNYGTLGNNLPPPAQVVEFLKTKTIIDKVKIFDCNPDIIRAFANSGLSLIITVPNGDIPNLALQGHAARRWVARNVKPFVPATKISHISVGNEILHSLDKNLIDNLVPAMRALSRALHRAGLKDIKVSTANSLGVMESVLPPSSGKFRPGWDTGVIAPMLMFLSQTKSPLMINPYPYFSLDLNANLDFALFKPNPGLFDPVTKITYTNLFDVLMDGVFTAMNRLGFGDVDIIVTEIGWPSAAEPGQPGVSPKIAADFNGNLIKHVGSGEGTPLMPKRNFDVYIFALFNENLKPGPNAERNWGLFWPDFSPVYDAGVLKNGQPALVGPGGENKKWCVARAEASEPALQAIIDWACGQGIDCGPIQPGAPCSEPATVRNHAQFVMNAYYQTHGRIDLSCDFSGSGVVTTVDPSYGACKFPS